MLTRLRVALLLRLGFPYLWLRWPLGIGRGISAAASNCRHLSSFEWWTRPYYERIARDFRSAGRFGYVWDEAMGVPFGPRIYNNTVTYWLYGTLSPRAFRLLTIVAYLGAIIAVGVLTGHFALALAIALLLLGSPVALHSLVGYMIKPEIPWWSLALLATTSALDGNWMLALGAGGVLLLVNASVAAITAMLLAPLWLYAALSSTSLPGELALLWLVPGILKNIIRILQARADSMGEEVATEQKKVSRERSITLREFMSLGLWFGVPWLMVSIMGEIAAVLVGGAATVFWFINRYLVKLADNVTAILAFLTVLIALALVSGSWVGLLGIAWFVFYQPFSSFPAMLGKKTADEFGLRMSGSHEERLSYLQVIASSFPWFVISSVVCPDAVKRLLEIIPDQTRVLLESDGDGRGAGSYLHFRNWADSMLSPRQVELTNQFFLVRLVEPLLADLYLDQFTAKKLDAVTMREVCCALGVSRVLAFTAETAVALERVGFRVVATVGAEEMAALADVLHMPATGIVLLAAPGAQTIVEPAVAWTRAGNILRWEASAGEDYLVRYRYHRNFYARQGGVPLEVRPAAVFDGLPLRFMRVRAVADGPLELKFRSGWLGGFPRD
jgi:hypothetical protein